MYEEYDFGKFKPYDHQLTTLEESAGKEYWAWFLEMGCGKSYICIHNFVLAYKKGWIDRVVIVAPKGVYMNWVHNEIPKYMPEDMDYVVENWDSAKMAGKAWQHKMAKFLNEDKPRLRILVVNPECFRVVRKRDADSLAYIRSFVKAGKAFISVDESTVIKSVKAGRTKCIVDIGELCEMRRIMSGYPNPESPLDFVGQCFFLSPSTFSLPRSLSAAYYAFRARYAIVEKQFMGNRSFDKIAGYQRLGELSSRLSKFSTRIKKRDCLDLPPKIYRQHVVTLSPKQRRAYNEMVADCVTTIRHQEEEHTITAEIVLTQIIRLQQILCGFTKSPDGDIIPVDPDIIPREEGLMSDLRRAKGKKVIIWSHFRESIRRIEALVIAEYGADSVACWTGGMKDQTKVDITAEFQDPDSKLLYIIAQQRAGGWGNTWTAATENAFYSNEYSAETRIQAEDRTHRIGQEESVGYTDFLVPGTVDEAILNDHIRKRALGDSVLEGEARLSDTNIKDTWLSLFKPIAD